MTYYVARRYAMSSPLVFINEYNIDDGRMGNEELYLDVATGEYVVYYYGKEIHRYTA
jgi:alkyl hydroperoxide reductase subunit AhpF